MTWLGSTCAKAIVRLPGPSYGADQEVKRAVELGLMIYAGVDEVPPAWMDTRSTRSDNVEGGA